MTNETLIRNINESHENGELSPIYFNCLNRALNAWKLDTY